MEKEHREAELELLHDAFVQALRDAVKAKDAPAATLEVVRKFLLDNGVADARPDSPVRDLTKALPFESVDEEIV